MFAVGLREHHQFHVGRVALELLEALQQVIDLVVGQRQAPVAVGLLQRGTATTQHIDVLHRHRVQVGEQAVGGIQRGQHAFGHAVVQQRGNLFQLAILELAAL